jgi:HPt (histidine-containing phosphotransfer) domain-containing protein
MTLLKGSAMNISSSSLLGSQGTSSVSSVSISITATLSIQRAEPATEVALSGPAQFLAALKQLQEQKPDQFKQVVAELAKQVKDAAEASTGPEKRFLERLAHRLDRVAETGNLAALQRGRHEEGRRAHGVQAYQLSGGNEAPPAARASHEDHDQDDDHAIKAAPSPVAPPPAAPPPVAPPPAVPPPGSATPPAASANPKDAISALLADLLKRVQDALQAPVAPPVEGPPASPGSVLGGLFEDLLKKVQDILVPPAPEATPAPAQTPAVDQVA